MNETAVLALATLLILAGVFGEEVFKLLNKIVDGYFAPRCSRCRRGGDKKC